MKPEQMSQLDLNLLVVLDVLLQERSVTRAGHRLRVTPSAVSHALSRLREVFDDELLVRDGRRMSPTTRARGLTEALPRALQQLAQTLKAPDPFVPATSSRTFRLAAPDFIAPMVLEKVGHVAPRVKVEWLATSSTSVQELNQGRFDALIAPRVLKNEGLRATPLGEWPWMVYGRARHPAFRDWSLEAWAAYPHLQIGTSVLRGPGPVEERASQLGISRQLGAVVPHFSMAAPIIANTDLLITVPAVIMQHPAKIYGLKVREVPFELPNMGLSVFRSAIRGDESGVRWFIEQIEAACKIYS